MNGSMVCIAGVTWCCGCHVNVSFRLIMWYR